MQELLNWKRLKPVFLVLGVLLLVQIGSGVFAFKQSKALLLESKLKRAQNLTQGLIVAVVDPLIEKDFSTLESRMMQTMYNDEVLSIQVVDSQGKVLTHLARTPGNDPLEIFDTKIVEVPSQAGLDHLSFIDGDTLVCWEKVNIGVNLGWIRLDMMSAVDGGELDVIKRNAFVLSAISILMGLTAIGMFLWRAYFSAIRRELSVTDQLKDTSEKLYQSEKMAALGQLSAGVAHEINNPIGYVSSNITSLVNYFDAYQQIIDAYERHCQPNQETLTLEQVNAIKEEINFEFIQEDFKFLLSETREGIQRVKTIIQDLKAFSRNEKVSAWSKADLHKGIASTLNIVASEFKNVADVELVFGTLPEIDCYPSQINQVVLNLVVNATQAIDPAQRGLIRITTSADDSHVFFTVSDSGCGMTEENMKNIFNPFFTTKAVGVGTGLGLSVTHGIIERHHGSISVQSEVGKGTTFKVMLPIHQTSAE